MDKERAFEILDCDPSSSEEEINEKFKNLAQENHPDQGGDDESMQEIIEARDTALEYKQSEVSLRVADIQELTTKSADKRQREKESQKTVNRLVRRHTSKYRRLRQVSVLVGLPVALIIGLVRIYSPGLDSGSFSLLQYPIFLLALATLFLLALGIFVYAQIMMRNIEILINEAEEALEDKTEIIRVVQEAGLMAEQNQPFTRGELERAVVDWIEGPTHMGARGAHPHEFEIDEMHRTARDRPASPLSMLAKVANHYGRRLNFLMPNLLDLKHIANTIGTASFSRLLLKKSLEKEVLEEVEQVDDEYWTIRYRVNKP